MLQPPSYHHLEKSLLEQFLAFTPQAAAIFDMNMCYVAVNPAWLDQYGLHDTALIGRNHYEVFPEVPQRWRDIHQRCLKGEVLSHDSDRFARKDGDVDYIKWTVRPWYTDEAAIGGLIMYTEVVTEKVTQSQETQRLQNLLQSILDHSPAWVFLKDRDFRYRFVNRAFAEAAGSTPEYFIGKNDYEVGMVDTHTIERPGGLRDTDSQVFESGEMVEIPENRGCVNNQNYVFFTRKVPIRDENGEIVQILGISFDITEEHRQRKIQRQIEARNRAMLEAIPDLLFIFDRDGRYLDIKDSEQLIASKDTLLGSRVHDFIPEDVADRLLTAIHKVLATGNMQIIHYSIDLPIGLRHYEGRLIKSGENEALMIGRDITESKKSEDALRASAANYRALVENNPDYVVRVDKDLTVQFINNVPDDVLDNLIGRPYRDMVANAHSSADAEILTGYIQQTLQVGYITTYESRGISRGTDEPAWYSTRIIPTREDDVITGATVIATDITERKKMEEALRESEARYRSIVETAQEGIWMVDADEKTTYANARIADMLGTTTEAMMGKTYWEFINPVHHPYVEQQVTKRDHDGSVVTEIPYERADGSQMWGLASVNLMMNGSGQHTGAIAMISDITERKAAENERERLFLQMELLYETSRELNTARTTQEFLNIVSSIAIETGSVACGFYHIHNDTQNQPVEAELISLWHNPNFPSDSLPIGSRFVLADYPFTQLWISSRSNVTIVENVTLSEQLDPKAKQAHLGLNIHAFVLIPLYQAGRWIGLFSLTWDQPRVFSHFEREVYRALPALAAPVADGLRLLENLEHTVEELHIANERSQETVRLKSEFLATMSHEMRTPMNAIAGFTSVMLMNMGEVEYNEKTRFYLERISYNSTRLLALINDFLDLSRIESGRLELTSLPVRLRELAERWHAELSVLIEEKDLDFVLAIADDFPNVIYCDDEAISKVAVNLLSNAIKFTERGQITVRVSHTPDQWTLAVADTGIGIPPHARDFIFDEFRQVDQTSKRLHGGTGLGLAIVQKLVRAMHGTVSLKSELNVGTTFTVVLPLHLKPDPELAP